MSASTEDFVARPSKRFFIEMFTRDISLVDCILDLVDNSVHSAISVEDFDVTAKLFKGQDIKLRSRAEIDLIFDGDQFTIKDNCHGMSYELAKNYVFRFGSPLPPDKRSGLGVYGIGLKRAIFKMGKSIQITSCTGGERWSLPILVDEWVKDEEDWNFHNSTHEVFTSGVAQKSETVIQVQMLDRLISELFKLASFINELTEKLSWTYALYIKAGVVIRVNGIVVKPEAPRVSVSRADTSSPYRKVGSEGDVDYDIVSGILDERDTTLGGWYVYCNGRMVVKADRSSTTGWGIDLPQFHVKFYRFVGYVFFSSRNLEALPWTTSKQGVNADNAAYRSAFGVMMAAARPVLSDIDSRYRGMSTEEAEDSKPESDVSSVQLDELPAIDTTYLSYHRTKPRDIVNVQYKARLSEVQAVKDAEENPSLSASAAGRLTFEYYLAREAQE
jgi:hypothetical protein